MPALPLPLPVLAGPARQPRPTRRASPAAAVAGQPALSQRASAASAGTRLAALRLERRAAPRPQGLRREARADAGVAANTGLDESTVRALHRRSGLGHALRVCIVAARQNNSKLSRANPFRFGHRR